MLDLILDPQENTRQRERFSRDHLRRAVPADPITNFGQLFLFPSQHIMPAFYSAASPAVLTSHRGEQMATPAEAPATPTTTDPIQSWLAR